MSTNTALTTYNALVTATASAKEQLVYDVRERASTDADAIATDCQDNCIEMQQAGLCPRITRVTLPDNVIDKGIVLDEGDNCITPYDCAKQLLPQQHGSGIAYKMPCLCICPCLACIAHEYIRRYVHSTCYDELYIALP